MTATSQNRRAEKIFSISSRRQVSQCAFDSTFCCKHLLSNTSIVIVVRVIFEGKSALCMYISEDIALWKPVASMPVTFELTVCITSTALFDCRHSHRIWKRDGLEAYRRHQRESAQIPLMPGVGFRLVESLLALNRTSERDLIEVVLVSRNDSESGERVRHSIAHYQLGITRMSFTCGTDVTKYLKSWNCDLFLTTEEEQVRTVLCGTNATRFKGIAAGLVCDITDETINSSADPP